MLKSSYLLAFTLWLKLPKDNTCACSECAFMKMNALQKLYDCLLNETPSIEVSEEVREKALIPIERMLELSK